MATQNLMLGDCLEWMKGLPDKYYDLAIVDPPYGINITKQGLGKGVGLYRQKEKAYKVGSWDSEIPTSEYFEELFRVSKNQIIWGGNYFTLKPTSCIIIWDKIQRIDQADCEIAWSSIDKAARIFQYARGNESGFAPMLPKEQKQYANIHPTQKPIALYKWLLTNYAKAGQKIFDSHGGSFSHAIAAYDLGFDLDIIEIDTDYYLAGVARYSAHKTKCEEIKQLGFAKTELSKTNPTLF